MIKEKMMRWRVFFKGLAYGIYKQRLAGATIVYFYLESSPIYGSVQ